MLVKLLRFYAWQQEKLTNFKAMSDSLNKNKIVLNVTCEIFPMNLDVMII